jgi:hypothetical protein
MIHWCIAAFAGALPLAAASAATAQETLALGPSSDWILDYADERCMLFRVFGEGREEVRLRIDSYGS